MIGSRRLRMALLAAAVAVAVAACADASDRVAPDRPRSTPTVTSSVTAPVDLPRTSADPAPEPPPAAPTPSTAQPSEPVVADRTVVCGGDPDELGFDPFYDRYCDAAGIPVLASSEVDPRAVEATADIMVAMIGHRPDLIEAIAAGGVRMGVLASTEVVTDLPEYRNLYEEFPGTDWNTRTRGLGATSYIPLSSAAEENVLCWPEDVYRGESILVHEFAHTVHIMGLDVVDPTFSPRLQEVYERAMAAGLWADTYAATNAEEYFAEAVQSWFDTNQLGPPGGDGIHNEIDTMAELAAYDPEVSELVAEVFLPDRLPLCPTR